MKLSQISGWFLLALGLIIIGWSLYSSYNIFTGKNDVPEIFKITEVKKESIQNKKNGTQNLQNQMEQMVGETIGEQIEKMLPASFLPKLLNLISWSIIAGILIFGGTQIAGIGVKLIKE